VTDPVPSNETITDHRIRDVLRVRPFRRLWTALTLSSFGDWLGLLALTALAARLAHGGYAGANIAVAGVFILRLAPAIVVGPLGGVIADRLDRRFTMVVCDVVRFGLFVSIPLVGTLWWLLVATFLIEAASLIWIPSKEATLPNLVPRERLESANQLSLFTTYGSAPLAAAVFAGLALLSGILDNAVSAIDEADLALYFNALTFLVSAITIFRIKEIPKRSQDDGSGRGGFRSIWRTVVEGWKFVAGTPLVRGLVAGMLGAFAAGGAVIGLARTFVTDLGAGDPGYGLLFGTVFCGIAGGMLYGPRLVPDFSRRRLFGLSISAAGVSLVVLALIPNMVIAALVTFVIGAWAGIAWVTGYTLLGLEVADDVRGRTFAFVQTMVRVTLVLVLAVSPLLAAAFGKHEIELTDAMSLTYNGAAITMLLAGVLATALGFASYRHMDDRRGIPLVPDLASAYRNEPVGLRRGDPGGGYFVAIEGGEGAGKSTQVELLAQWLRDQRHDVLVTFEPGATDVGRRLRSVLLDRHDDEPTPLSPRAEALLFAADRAEHVTNVVVPALAAGSIVITDRYIDSSLAYQGSGRALDESEILRLSRWATDGLRPDITVLLDLPAADGLRRVQTPDRLESEPVEFHERVRERYLELARRGGHRYLVVDATRSPDAVAEEIRSRLSPLLPTSRAELAEREAAAAAAEEQARREQQDRERLEQEARAAREQEEATARAARDQAAAEERARRQQAKEAEQARRDAERAARQSAAAEEKERRRLAAEAAAAAAAEQRAKQALEDAERRAAAGRHRAESSDPASRRPADTGRSPAGDDPPTRPLSLTDELFGLGDEADETVQLPRVRDRGEDR
jgi:dTMP kinase